MDYCKKGHAKTNKNSKWVTSKGKRYRACKRCIAKRVRFQYRHDPVFRAKTIEIASKFYYKRKAEKQSGLAEVSG